MERYESEKNIKPVKFNTPKVSRAPKSLSADEHGSGLSVSVLVVMHLPPNTVCADKEKLWSEPPGEAPHRKGFSQMTFFKGM